MFNLLNKLKVFISAHLGRDTKVHAFLRKIYKSIFRLRAKNLSGDIKKLEKALAGSLVSRITKPENLAGVVIEIGSKKLWWKDPTDPNHLLSIIVLTDGGEFEPQETNLFSKLIKPQDTVLDIGANFGWHSLTFAKLASAGQVICFEPDEKTYTELKTNIELSLNKDEQSRVKLEKLALGDDNKEVSLFVPKLLGAAFASVMPDYYEGFSGGDETEKIEMKKLDTYLEEKNITKIDFIKCDVEGAPHLVVEGARKLLSREDAPLLFVEITKRNPDEFNTFNLLENLGYQSFVLRNNQLIKINKEDLGNKMADYNFLFAKKNHLSKIESLIK